MSDVITCHGCGRCLSVPDNYARSKMRCPDCGVICNLPVPTRKAAPARRSSPEPDVASEPPPQDFRPPTNPEPAAPPPAKDAAPPRKTIVLTCDTCGERVRVVKHRDEPARCPVCGEEIRSGRTRSRHAEKAWGADAPPPIAEPEADLSDLPAIADDEDDDRPYDMTGDPDRFCPTCSKLLPRGAQVCVRCGLDLRSGQKTARVFAKVQREWEAGLPLRTRIKVFLGCQLLYLATGLAAVFYLDRLDVAAFAWLVFTLMTAFLLGTFDRVSLSRNERGKIVLTKTWYIFFWPQPTKTLRLSEFDGVTTNRVEDTDLWDWLVLLMLLPGGITALIWWYLAIHRETFQVALTSDHGYAAFILYRGGNQARTIEIAETIRDVTGLPYDGS